MFSSRGIRVLLHGTGWLLFFGLILASSAINRNNSLTEIFSPAFLLFYALYLFLFYLNHQVLLPRLYLQKKYVLYFSIIIALLVGVAALQPFDKIVKGQRETIPDRHPQQFPSDQNFPRPPHRRPPGYIGPKPQHIDIVGIVLFLAVWAVSMVLSLFRQWQQTEQRAVQAELERTNAELSFLKAQVNPHFLFNTLNNIYSLAVEKSDRAPVAVMKLSNIMRYVTDEAKHDFVPLASEVACISDYIALQQLRLTEKTKVRFTTSGAFDQLQIAPLLLMPFVENVFKYGVSAHQPSVIVIALQVMENTLHFFCSNPIIKTTIGQPRAGIGIENTKARLQHLYPKEHTLDFGTENEQFHVQLIIKLSC